MRGGDDKSGMQMCLCTHLNLIDANPSQRALHRPRKGKRKAPDGLIGAEDEADGAAAGLSDQKLFIALRKEVVKATGILDGKLLFGGDEYTPKQHGPLPCSSGCSCKLGSAG
jgi:hypothetical protein